MKKVEMYREVIGKYPRSTNKEIAKRTDQTEAAVGSFTTRAFGTGELMREKVGQTLSGVPIYAYWRNPDYVKKTARKHRSLQEKNVPSKAKISETAFNLDATIDQIAQQIAQQLAHRIKAHVANELTVLVPEIPMPAGAPPAVLPTPDQIAARAPQAEIPTKRKRRVLVVGLLPSQCGVLSTEFHDALDLSFWNDKSGDGDHRLRAMAKGSDMVFLHTAHSAHRIDELVKASGADFKRVSGGVTAMREALLNYYVMEGANG